MNVFSTLFGFPFTRIRPGQVWELVYQKSNPFRPAKWVRYHVTEYSKGWVKFDKEYSDGSKSAGEIEGRFYFLMGSKLVKP